MTRVSIFAIVAAVCANASALTLEAKSGSTEFLAIGRPSALKIAGKGDGPTGELHFKKDGDAYVINGDALMDLSSLDTGIGLRDRHMKDKYLEVEKFKEARVIFKDVKIPIDKISKGGEAQVAGLLKLHGEEKQVPVQLKIETKEGRVKTVATFKLKLSEFKIDIPKFSGITVADEVNVSTETTVPEKAVKEVL